MFFRGLFKFFLKFVNYSKVVRYFNLFYFTKLISMDKNIKNVELLDKFALFFLSNVNSKKYNLFNKNTVDVIFFRKKNLPLIEEWFRKTIYHHYNIFYSPNMIVNFFFFIEVNSTTEVFKKMFNCENSALSVGVLMKTFSTMNHYFNKHFYNTSEEDNLVKIYFILYTLFLKNSSSNFLKFYDLNNYKSWFEFTQYLDKPHKILNERNWEESSLDDDALSKFSEEKDKSSLLSMYRTACLNYFDKTTSKLIETIYDVRINLNGLWSTHLNTDFSEKLKNYFPIRYSDSSINKFIDMSKIDNFVVYHLRKIKIFNKGRYSRNRQTYRTGFYWCLWLNIFVVYGLQFVFYRYTFTYGYLWVFLFIFIGTFVFSRALKYNFISWNYIWTEKKEFFKFLRFIFLNFYFVFKKSMETFIDYFRISSNGSEYSNVWNDSKYDTDYKRWDFTIGMYSVRHDYWYKEIKDFVYGIIETFFEYSLLRKCLIDIDMINTSDELCKANTYDRLQDPHIWLTDIHERTSEMYLKIMDEYNRHLLKKFLNK